MAIDNRYVSRIKVFCLFVEGNDVSGVEMKGFDVYILKISRFFEGTFEIFRVSGRELVGRIFCLRSVVY